MGEAKRRREMAQVVVGVDDGYAQVKVFGATGKVVVASAVRSGASLSALDGGSAGVFETEGVRYSAGEGVDGEETRFNGYHTSPLNRVAVHHGLHAIGLAGQEVQLMLGLPLRDYFQGTAVNRELIAAKKASFAVPVDKRGANRVVVSRAQVMPQAISALVDWGIHEDGSSRPEMQESEKAAVAVVDIGGRTTDVAVVIGGNTIDHRRSGTANVGVLTVYEAVADALRARFGIDEEVPRLTCEEAVSGGTVRLFGKQHDVADLVRSSLEDVSGQIERCVKRYLGSGGLLAAVLFVGGGAKVFGEVVKAFPHNGHIVEEPEFANARGMFRFASLQR